MTSLDEPTTAAEPVIVAEAVPPSRWERFDDLLGRLSDRLNPILVKEARQALRSRQFTTTFMLMLAAGWTWSMLGLALLGPSAYYNADGPTMFYVYYMILAAPLVVAIPYFAYNSLSSERHDRTYELVSITALDASRILLGKLGGIGMQMIVYLSALFPCLAFTYLLRGLDIFTVLLAVGYTCLVSFGLAMIGLLLAALTASRQRHIVQGVLFAGFLCWAFVMLLTIISGLVAVQGASLADPDFLQFNVAAGLFYVNAFALVFLAARAQLTMASQNRSTALRVALTAAHLTAIGWFSWAVLQVDEDFVFGLIFLATAGWYFCGVFMVGESQALSQRVRRELPQSFFGRLLLTWYMPGPGTGYMFVLVNMVTLTEMAMLMSSAAFRDAGARLAGRPVVSGGGVTPMEVCAAAVVATSYVVIYLGLAKLILGAARRFGEVSLMLRFLVGGLLIMAGGGIPWVIQITNPATRDLDYTLLQLSNPVWTLWEYCTSSGPPVGIDTWVLVSLPVAALVVWGMNLRSISAELLNKRLPTPTRIAEDDTEQRLAAAATARLSPWDE